MLILRGLKSKNSLFRITHLQELILVSNQLLLWPLFQISVVVGYKSFDCKWEWVNLWLSVGLVGGRLTLMGVLPNIQSLDFYSWSPMVGIFVIHIWLILIPTLFTKAKFICPVCYHINTVPPIYYFSLIAEETISKATTVIYGIIGGVKFPFAGVSKDACQDQGLTCPLKPGTENTFKTVLPVKPLYPTVSSFSWSLQSSDFT